MNAKVVAFTLLLVVLYAAPLVYALSDAEILAQNQQNNAVTTVTTVPQGNAIGDSQLLAAQVTQEVRKSNDEIIKAVNEYNDENFQIFDARLQQTITDIKMKVALGAIGAALLANALVAYIIMRTMKNYSYEKYQEKLIGKLQSEVQEKDATIQGMQQMAGQETWNPQQTNPTLGMVYGQQFASDATQMNAWQSQPAYGGAWQSPVPVQPEYSHIPAGYKYAAENREDPMQSPQWNLQQ